MCGVGERSPAALPTALPEPPGVTLRERKFTATRTTLLNSARPTSGLLPLATYLPILPDPIPPNPSTVAAAAIAVNFENSAHKTFRETAAVFGVWPAVWRRRPSSFSLVAIGFRDRIIGLRSSRYPPTRAEASVKRARSLTRPRCSSSLKLKEFRIFVSS